jgi:hypothetical protein
MYYSLFSHSILCNKGDTARLFAGTLAERPGDCAPRARPGGLRPQWQPSPLLTAELNPSNTHIYVGYPRVSMSTVAAIKLF